jgi:glycosyltransferase involved in cell wall biosynthesis
MVFRVLAIGDLANGFVDLRKYMKNSTIHIINFPWDTASKLTESKDVEFFRSLNIIEQIEKINSIKKDFDFAIVNTWAGARLAYLTGMDYILFFVGSALRVPPFIKNPMLDYLEKPLPSLNFFERRFYRKILDNAILCGANDNELYKILQKYRKEGIFLIRNPVDKERFHENLSPINWEKTKFTFISFQRIGLVKGIDMIWKAIELTKTDFEVLQVEWFLGQRTDEEKLINKNLIDNRPKKVKLIPVIKREDMPNVYAFSDGIIGQMKNGMSGNIEREAAFCKKPVIQYADPEIKYEIDGKEIKSPFLPETNQPEEIAKVLDKIVVSKEFRDELVLNEYNFVKKVFDPEYIAQEWQKKFMDTKKLETRNKSSGYKLRIRLLNFLIINRLYLKKIRNKI